MAIPISKLLNHPLPLGLAGIALTAVLVAAALAVIGGAIEAERLESLRHQAVAHAFDLQADVVGRIREALSAQDRPTAVRIAHTLKGLAGNVGIDALQQAAAALERGLAEGHTDVSAQLEALDALVSPIIGVLSGLRKEREVLITRAVVDPQTWRPLLQTLRTQLQDFDAEAVNSVASLRTVGIPEEAVQVVEGLSAAIDEFDFEVALQRLDGLEPLLLVKGGGHQ